MQIAPRPRRPRAESIVPMINVVFLLLIFFLMTAEIAPPEPFAVTLPGTEDDLDPAQGLGGPLFVSADGVVAWQDLVGDAAVAAFAAAYRETTALGDRTPVDVRADRAVPAAVIAGLLPQLAAAGIESVSLLTAAP